MNPSFAILVRNGSAQLPQGTRALFLEKDKIIQGAVAAHTDLLFGIYGDFAVIRRSAFEESCTETRESLEKLLKAAGIKLYVTEAQYGPGYPSDCGLCAAYGCYNGRKYIITNPEYCDALLWQTSMDFGYEHIRGTKQGYAKCSCAVLSDGSVITEDPGICKALDKAGIPCLFLNEKFVLLPGYPCGFIGGCTGLYKDTLYFNGCVEAHPEYPRMKEFADYHNTRLVSLGTYRLTDIGSIFFI